MEKIDSQLEQIKSGTLEILPEIDLEKKLESGRPLVVKLGVDPTAPDLHLGHAVPLRKLRTFQDLGHQVVLIIGDFTAMIGDPSGRSKTRPKLSEEEIKANAATYMDQAFKILDKDKTKLVFNSEWLGRIEMKKILELLGRFTVTALLQRDDFEKRYKNNEMIGLHEFLYPVMQAYDSLELNADIEIGGSDQKFNLLAGRELQQKMGKEPQICITMPLLEGTDGVRKMSKSYGNHIGLTFPPVDMFYAIMRIPDEMLIKYFQLATMVDDATIRKIEKGLKDETLHPRDAHLRLGREIVTIYYDEQKAEEAEKYYLDGATGKTVHLSGKAEGKSSASGKLTVNHGTLEISHGELKDGKIWIVSLVKKEGAASSTGEARRLITQGGVRLDGEKVMEPSTDIDPLKVEFIEIGKRPRKKINVVSPSE